MVTEEILIIGILLGSIIGSVGAKLYYAKKNDGVITSDEVKNIVKDLGDSAVEILQELITVKGLSKIEKRSVLQKEIIKSISDSPLTENQKNFVNDNINLITDQLIEKSNKVLDDIISKKVDKELKNRLSEQATDISTPQPDDNVVSEEPIKTEEVHELDKDASSTINTESSI